MLTLVSALMFVVGKNKISEILLRYDVGMQVKLN